jgi:predicted aspartyl protease
MQHRSEGTIMVMGKDMGKVNCEIKVENTEDLLRVRRGELSPDQVRSIIVTDALVDTGASTLSLPSTMLRRLGLDTPVTTKRTRNTTGAYVANLYGPVRLWILGRDMTLDVMEVADECPVLIGQIPLEYMQLIVDMANHKISKSPANNGEWILDMFCVQSESSE